MAWASIPHETDFLVRWAELAVDCSATPYPLSSADCPTVRPTAINPLCSMTWAAA